MGGVEGIMRAESQGILTTTPDVKLDAIIGKLNKVTGGCARAGGAKSGDAVKVQS